MESSNLAGVVLMSRKSGVDLIVGIAGVPYLGVAGLDFFYAAALQPQTLLNHSFTCRQEARR